LRSIDGTFKTKSAETAEDKQSKVVKKKYKQSKWCGKWNEGGSEWLGRAMRSEKLTVTWLSFSVTSQLKAPNQLALRTEMRTKPNRTKIASNTRRRSHGSDVKSGWKIAQRFTYRFVFSWKTAFENTPTTITELIKTI